MTQPTVIISENSATGCSLSAAGVRDVSHVRRLLLQSTFAVENEGVKEHAVPEVKLHLLRGFLSTIDAADKPSARRLLLMALLQLEDEDDQMRFAVPHPLLPIITPR